MPERTPGLLERLRRYLELYSWKELGLFKASDLLARLEDHPTRRRIRALRRFSLEVPPREVTFEDGEYRFRDTINDRPVEIGLRARSSDVSVFLQILRDGEYADVARLLSHLDAPRRIVDAGANVGLATLYFKCVHPDAEVLALEPEADNFVLLERCIRENGLRGVTASKRAIWTHEARLLPDRGFRDGEAWSFALREGADPDDPECIDAEPLASLLDGMEWSEVDLLKLDVEGAEAPLLRDARFLETVRTRVKVLCVEVHEEIMSRAEARDSLAGIGWPALAGGESLVAWTPESGVGPRGA